MPVNSAKTKSRALQRSWTRTTPSKASFGAKYRKTSRDCEILPATGASATAAASPSADNAPAPMHAPARAPRKQSPAKRASKPSANSTQLKFPHGNPAARGLANSQITSSHSYVKSQNQKKSPPQRIGRHRLHPSD